MKKIYFACSIRGGRDDAEIYAELVKYIKQHAEVLSEIFADSKLTTKGMNKPSRDIWKIDTDWIKQADAIIAEVTNPSLGVGYEIALAETLNKPILALFRNTSDKKLSAMIDGSPAVRVCYYQEISDAKLAVDEFIK
ncbi:MAG: nucleoside 2-deoxyribosyltransferase [bacterium]|nr:nucleoside 2-deoxyribosyltransferase [bacterium]